MSQIFRTPPTKPRTHPIQIMKKQFALCLTVACALLLSSCSSGFVRCGTFGPGQAEQYMPITGLPGQCTFQRNIVLDPGCRTGQPNIYSRSRVISRPAPRPQYGCYPQQGWQQPPPMFGYPLMQPHPPRYPNHAGVINGSINQPRWCPPVGRPLHPEPLVYNPYSGRWEPRRCR